MAACIRVESGIAAGSVLWIEKAVVRVGSDPAADLCLPTAALESHALTVEVRGDAIRLYNRSSQAVFLGGQPLQPQQFTSWLDPDILELPDGIRLSLDQDAERETAMSFDESNQSETEGETNAALDEFQSPSFAQADLSGEGPSSEGPKNKGASIWPQIAVTLLCIGLAAFLLVRQQVKASQLSGPNRVDFATLVEPAESTTAGLPQPLVRHLQFAESAFVRGHRKLARKRYLEIHQGLQAGANDDPVTSEIDSAARQRVEQFVQRRLAELS